MDNQNQTDPPIRSEAAFARLSAEERTFVSSFLKTLASEDMDTMVEILTANPGWVEAIQEDDGVLERVGDALSGKLGLTPAQQQIAADVQRSLLERAHAAPSTTAGQRVDQQTGILTTVTRQLPPEKAVELYRKIAPVFVYQLLNRIDESTSLRVVHSLVDHLCHPDVQTRLREHEHVRDAIMDEFCAILGQSELHRKISRSQIDTILEECGAMDELITMENCIKLIANRAG